MFTKPKLYARIGKQKVILKVLTIIHLLILILGSRLSSAAVVVLRILIFCKELTP